MDTSAEITRCVCGHEELQTDDPDVDSGLFIQCDKCQVWQHFYCVGLRSDDEAPEDYACEKCRPELHLIVVRPTGRTSQYIPLIKDNALRELKESARNTTTTSSSRRAASEAAHKRRSTLNSRDSNYDEILRRVLEESTHDAGVASSSGGTSDSESAGDGNNADDNDDDEAQEHHRHRRRRTTNESLSKRHQDSEDSGDDDAGLNRDTKDVKLSSAAQKEEDEIDEEKDRDNEHEEEEEEEEFETTRRSRKAQTTEDGEDSNGSGGAHGFTSNLMSGEKPSKPRAVQNKSSVADMRKRVAAILEFIGRVQLDMAAEQDERRRLVSTASAAMSESGLAVEHERSIEMMDLLTRKLLLWEKEYGRYGERA
ncbi:uncharacterized protein V1516DRAFT_625296 [Lipomyces oligophaga]|uniref:uncharacterized protein n=1 Tax=Lipomyces oligophaga TaxID=45792 RepID=UPI0034CD8F2A